jgi:hypothetical protein
MIIACEKWIPDTKIRMESKNIVDFMIIILPIYNVNSKLFK